MDADALAHARWRSVVERDAAVHEARVALVRERRMASMQKLADELQYIEDEATAEAQYVSWQSERIGGTPDQPLFRLTLVPRGHAMADEAYRMQLQHNARQQRSDKPRKRWKSTG